MTYSIQKIATVQCTKPGCLTNANASASTGTPDKVLNFLVRGYFESLGWVINGSNHTCPSCSRLEKHNADQHQPKDS